MMNESELRRRFAELREADRAHGSSFAQTYGRARAREGWRTAARVRLLVISGAAAVAIFAGLLGRARSYSPNPVSPTITTWRAPTDVLLRTPGRELLGAMPALGASVLDAMISTPSMRGT